jgi:hypothetical protein
MNDEPATDYQAAVKILERVSEGTGFFTWDGFRLRPFRPHYLDSFGGEETAQGLTYAMDQRWVQTVGAVESYTDDSGKSRMRNGSVYLLSMAGHRALIEAGLGKFQSNEELLQVSKARAFELLRAAGFQRFSLIVTTSGPSLASALLQKQHLETGIALAFALEQCIVRLESHWYIVASNAESAFLLTQKENLQMEDSARSKEIVKPETSASNTPDLTVKHPDDMFAIVIEALHTSHPSVNQTWGRRELVQYCLNQEPSIAVKARIAMEILANWEASELTKQLLTENERLAHQTTNLATETHKVRRGTVIMAFATIVIAFFTVVGTMYSVFHTAADDAKHQFSARDEVRERETDVLRREVDMSEREKNVLKREAGVADRENAVAKREASQYRRSDDQDSGRARESDSPGAKRSEVGKTN